MTPLNAQRRFSTATWINRENTASSLLPQASCQAFQDLVDNGTTLGRVLFQVKGMNSRIMPDHTDGQLQFHSPLHETVDSVAQPRIGILPGPGNKQMRLPGQIFRPLACAGIGKSVFRGRARDIIIAVKIQQVGITEVFFWRDSSG